MVPTTIALCRLEMHTIEWVLLVVFALCRAGDIQFALNHRDPICLLGRIGLRAPASNDALPILCYCYLGSVHAVWLYDVNSDGVAVFICPGIARGGICAPHARSAGQKSSWNG